MQEPKYKVGEFVTLKGMGETKHKAQIIQVDTATCTAGTQVLYKLRVWLLSKKPAAYTGLSTFNEIEIEGKFEQV